MGFNFVQHSSAHVFSWNHAVRLSAGIAWKAGDKFSGCKNAGEQFGNNMHRIGMIILTSRDKMP